MPMRAEISRSMTVAELVTELYGERPRRELRRAERALLEANPLLEGRETIPARTTLEVPELAIGAPSPSRALGIRILAGESRAAPTPRELVLARSEATVAIAKAAKKSSDPSFKPIEARLANAHEAAKGKLAADEALAKNLQLIAERVWNDADALVAVLRG
jgi:hypothetical protein